jgi:hypothetical protein
MTALEAVIQPVSSAREDDDGERENRKHISKTISRICFTMEFI